MIYGLRKYSTHLQQVKEKFPLWVPQTAAMTRQILEGSHPAFPPEQKK